MFVQHIKVQYLYNISTGLLKPLWGVFVVSTSLCGPITFIGDLRGSNLIDRSENRIGSHSCVIKRVGPVGSWGCKL